MFVLQPGIYSVSYATDNRHRDDVKSAEVFFEVTEAGTVDFHASFDEVLEGRGGNVLFILGAVTELNAAAFGDEPSVEIVGIGLFSTGTSHFLSLLPGTHRLKADRAEWLFSVNLDATVDYDPTMNDVLVGRGTATLIVLGAPDNPPDTLSRIVNLAVATEEAYPTEHGARALALELLSLAPYDHVNTSLTILHAYIQLIEHRVAAGDVALSRGQLLLDRAAIVERELARLR